MTVGICYKFLISVYKNVRKNGRHSMKWESSLFRIWINRVVKYEMFGESNNYIRFYYL